MGHGRCTFPFMLGEFQVVIGVGEAKHDTVIPIMLMKFTKSF